MSDIDIAVADSLKVLDLKRPIREATEIVRRRTRSGGPLCDIRSQQILSRRDIVNAAAAPFF